MGKQYLKAFRRKILFLHITVSITITLALLFFYFFADRVMNGAIVDFIASVMGWSMASYAMAYKSALMVFFYLLCIAVGFICVEQYAMSRLSGVVTKMGRLFDTGEERKWKKRHRFYWIF